jgi:mannose-binding lectin 2
VWAPSLLCCAAGITAATGDLADNHDVISFKVIDPQPMSPYERDEIGSRIELDIEAGVEDEVHHDPQYDGAGVSRQTEHHELPLWVTLSAIALVGTGAGVVFFLTQRSQANTNSKPF